MKQLKIILILLAFFPLCSEATHIVGGEINYTCLGGDEYQVDMVVYRDCINGVPYFDDPASLGIFYANDNLFRELRMPVLADDTIPGNLSDSCFVEPPLACVHVATYRDTVELPFSSGGYQFAYQRCCRNGTILNIVEPDSTGITLYTTISEEGLLACNSSPYFKEWPPIYICAGLPIIFDHSTTDADGDSVVYEMCAPFDGAESFGNYNCVPQPCGVRPQPPFNPQYDSVVYSPTYGTFNMLGGLPALTIDVETGLLTGTPCCIGQYVVGVCANEYRNGVLMGTIKRDFQYNIGNCQLIIVSSFFTPEIVCTNDVFNVSFDNMSVGSNNYTWDFGDPTTTTDVSNLANPTYIYPDTGRYTVTLIAGPDVSCSDTSYQEIYLQYESINVDFTLDYENCQDSIVIDFIDISTDSISTIVDWYWDFGNGDTSSVQYPVITYDSPGTYLVELTVTAENGCQGTATYPVEFGMPQIMDLDSLLLCTGDPPIGLNPDGNANYIYEWSPPDGLSSTTVANPLANPTETTTYVANVTTINPFDTCSVEQMITVVVPPALSVYAGEDTVTCNTSVYLDAQAVNAVEVAWSEDPNFTTIINAPGTTGVLVMPTPSQTYYVMATDAFGCTVVDDVFVNSISVNIEAEPEALICLNDSVYLEVINSDPADDLTYSWTPDELILSGQNTSTTLVSPNESTTYWVFAENQYGCVDSTAVFVDVSSQTPPLEVWAEQDSIYPGETVGLFSTLDDNYTYEWTPHPSLSDVDIPNPTATILEATTFDLLVTDEYGCINLDSVTIRVKDFICADPYIFVPNAFTPNGDGLNDVLYVRANAVTDVFFAVYNRWGELMFESESLDNGWDGTYEGRVLSPDVYAFYLKVRCLNEEEYFKKGNVTLIR